MNYIFADFVASLGGVLPLLLDSALKAALLLGLAAVATTALPNASAATRHFIWLFAVVAVLVLPLLSPLLPGWNVLPRWTTVAKPASPVLDAKVASPMVEAIEPTSGSVWRSSTPSHGAAREVQMTVRDGMLIAWAVGSALLILRVFAAHWFLARLTKACTTSNDVRLATIMRDTQRRLGVPGSLRLLLDSRRTIPLVCGVFEPRLLLPAEAMEWSDSRVRSVFLHEVAHVKRRDIAVQWLTQFACALHWFNPLVWLAARRIQTERERACDDLVLASGVRPSEYAGHLLNLATKLAPFTWMDACGVAMARPSRLEGRLLAVLNEQLNRNPVTRALALAILALGLCILVPVTILRAAAEQERLDEAPALKEVKPGGGAFSPQPPNSAASAREGAESAPDREVEKKEGQEASRSARAEAGATRTEDKVPILGDIPIIGRLFRKTSAVASNDSVARQIELLEKEIQLAEQQVRVAADQYKIGHVMGDALLLRQKELASLERDLAKLRNDPPAFERAIQKQMDLVKTLRAANEARVKVGTDTPDSLLGFDRELLHLERELAAGPHDASGSVNSARPTNSETTLIENAQQAERELEALRQKFTESHPAVQAARDRVERLRREEKIVVVRSPPRRDVVLSAPRPGVVKKILVVNEAKVKKGQRLIELDDREERAKLARVLAELEASNAALKVQEVSAKSAAVERTRANELAEQKLISQSELASKAQASELAQANIGKARADVSVAEQQVRQCQVALEMLTILAPKDGTILRINISEGEYASSTTQPLIVIGE